MATYPDQWAAKARLELRRRQRTAVTEGPYLVMPALDPPLVPPDDPTLIEVEAPPEELRTVSGEGLAAVMEEFNRERGA
jgi:hypothetical protein